MKRLQQCTRASLLVGGSLMMVAAWSDPLVYVSNNETNTIAVVDAATSNVDEIIELADYDDQTGSSLDVNGLALSPDGSILYLDDFTGFEVDGLAFPFDDINEPSNLRLLVNEAGTEGYALGENRLYVFDLETRTEVIAADLRHDSGQNDHGQMILSPDESRLYVTTQEHTDGVEVFDLGTHEWVGDTIELDLSSAVATDAFPVGIDVHPDGSRLYVAEFDATNSGTEDVQAIGRISVIDTVTREVEAVDIGNGTADILLSPGGDLAYITNFYGDSVSVMDTQSLTEVAEIEVGDGPWTGLALNSTGSRLFVGNVLDGTLSIIDTETRQTIGEPIDLGLAGEEGFLTSIGQPGIRDIVVGSASPDIVALAVDPAYPMNLYAGTDGAGLYRSTDGGANWEQANAGLTDVRITELAITSGGEAVYAGTHSGGVFKSTDYGASWSPVNLGLSTAVRALEVAPDDDQTVYVGVAGGAGVYTSTNGGASWEQSSEGLPDEFVD